MSPVHRYHEGGIVVPLDLIEAVDSLFDINDGFGEDHALYDLEALDLERFVAVPRLGDSVVTDALVVSRARNVLDGWTLSDECRSEKIPNSGEQTPIGVTCDFCMWCQALILRDWCDAVLDRAGYLSRNAWIGVTPDDYHPDQDYARIWAEVNAAYNDQH